MRKYIIKRVLFSVLILILVTFVLYTLIRCLPTSYVEQVARQKSMQPGSKSFEEWMEQLSSTYGLNKSIPAGYLTWAGRAVRGDFGDSWLYTVPVIQKFKETIPISIAMNLTAFILELMIAIPLAILAATRQYSKTDYTISVFSLLGFSLPTFFFASLLKLLFSVKLGWFDLGGLVGRNYDQLDTFGKLLDRGHHLVLPVITMVVVNIGMYVRYTRTNMLEVLSADYIRTARAKGLPESRVVFAHAFRNTLITLVTIVGNSLPALFNGALITETLYSIQGTGYTAYGCLRAGDIPFSMFFLTFIAIMTLLGNLIADILYAVVDPRVRIS